MKSNQMLNCQLATQKYAEYADRIVTRGLENKNKTKQKFPRILDSPAVSALQEEAIMFILVQSSHESHTSLLCTQHTPFILIQLALPEPLIWQLRLISMLS